MNDVDLKILKDGGIDTKEALERLDGNEKLFLKVLNKFATDTNYNDYCQRLKEGDIENAERSLHALKGIAGNLGITELYSLSVEIDEGLKKGKVPNQDKIERFNSAYENAISSIKKLGQNVGNT